MEASSRVVETAAVRSTLQTGVYAKRTAEIVKLKDVEHERSLLTEGNCPSLIARF